MRVVFFILYTAMHVNWKTFTCPIIVAMRNLFCMRYSYLNSKGIHIMDVIVIDWPAASSAFILSIRNYFRPLLVIELGT